MSSILPAVFTGIVFALAAWRLPLLHPLQVWTGSWAVSTTLYALRLLPYRTLGSLTAGLICGSVVALALGVMLGARLAARRHPRPMARQHETIVLAGFLAIGLLALTLAVFIAQLASRYGVGRVVRLSPEVKLYLSGGEAPLSGVYVSVAIASAALCALAGARAATVAARRRWLVGAAVCAASVYFSTSRGFIAVALISGIAAFLCATPEVNRRRLAVATTAAGIVILVLYVSLGPLLGKTYANSTIGEFDNFFSQHPSVSWAALPYQDLTASIPALDRLVDASPTWGIAHGCATAPIACGVVRKLGVDALRVPVAGPFTKTPLPWNAYTFLDRFLIDGGPALTLPFVVLTGLLAGYFWAYARAGSAYGMLVYALSVPALMAAYRQNLMEIVGIAAVCGIALLLLARLLLRLRVARRRDPALA